jgi:hypothetical protein
VIEKVDRQPSNAEPTTHDMLRVITTLPRHPATVYRLLLTAQWAHYSQIRPWWQSGWAAVAVPWTIYVTAHQLSFAFAVMDGGVGVTVGVPVGVGVNVGQLAVVVGVGKITKTWKRC